MWDNENISPNRTHIEIENVPQYLRKKKGKVPRKLIAFIGHFNRTRQPLFQYRTGESPMAQNRDMYPILLQAW